MDSKIVQLAKQLLSNVQELDSHIQSHNLPQPTFEIDGPLDYDLKSASADAARLAAIENAIELHDLLIGPTMILRPMYNATSLQSVYKLDIARKVPMDGEISFTELASRCDIYEPDLKRILRFAMCYYHAFREPRKGFVSHTAVSRAIVESQGVRDALGVMFDECWPAYAKTVEAMEKFKSQGINQAGYSLAHNTDLPFFEYISGDKERSRRFAGAMEAFGGGPDISPSFLVNGFPWGSLGAATIVDVGGSNGAVCIAIAEAHPALKFMVQDRAEVVQTLKHRSVPSALEGRVEFMAHNFFTPQPVVADVYLFRYIFHNWPDAYAIKILRHLIPALKPGARVLINDHLLPEPNTASLTAEREIRSMDMLMLTLCNARERDRDDWEMLFKQADDRFLFVGLVIPEGSSLAIVEAMWQGEGPLESIREP